MANWEARREGWKQQAEDARDPFDVDYGRVIHSASFRRLQGKTQILNLGDSDFYRTRLTHSLEVAQIGTGIVRQLKKHHANHECSAILPETSLIQSICLTHDLGHPPFGHGGEIALNYCMRDHGGFEANAQSLRILSKLEKFSKGAGANLTRRTLLGILKYPISYNLAHNPRLRPRLADNTTATHILDRKVSKPPKSYHDSEQAVVDWLLGDLSEPDKSLFMKMEFPDSAKHGKARHKSFDCSIMDLADDIAYGVHDLEDVIALGLVDQEDFRSSVPETACSRFLDLMKEKYPNEFRNDVYEGFVQKLFSGAGERKHQFNRIVGHFITNVEPYVIDGFQEPLLKYRVRLRPEFAPFLDALKQFVFNKVIGSPNVQHLEFKGQQMVLAAFEAFTTDPGSFLPQTDFYRFKGQGGDVRVICDYIAGMTDYYLLRTFERLYSPRMGSVFDLI